jgi:hypothetical protein
LEVGTAVYMQRILRRNQEKMRGIFGSLAIASAPGVARALFPGKNCKKNYALSLGKEGVCCIAIILWGIYRGTIRGEDLNYKKI